MMSLSVRYGVRALKPNSFRLFNTRLSSNIHSGKTRLPTHQLQTNVNVFQNESKSFDSRLGTQMNYSSTVPTLYRPTLNNPQSGKIYEDEISAAEREQEIIKAQSISETGTENTYNNLIQSLQDSLSALESIQNDDTSTEEEIIECMQKVAQSHWDLGMLEQAQEMQENILSKLMNIHSSTSADSPSGSPQHIDIAITMHTIGSIQSRLNDPQEAEKWLNAALSMKKTLLSKYAYHYEIGKTTNGLAAVKMQLDDEKIDPYEIVQLLEESERHYTNHGELQDYSKDESCIDMSDHPHVAAINCNIAGIYRQFGDLKMAFQRYENALRIEKHWAPPLDLTLYGNEHIMNLNIDTGDCLNGLEQWDNALERYQEALRLHMLIVKRESRQQEENDGNNADEENSTPAKISKEATWTPLTGILKHNIGLVYAHLERYEEAMIEYQEALQIKRSLDSNHPEVAKTLNAVGAMQAAKGEGRSAMVYFKEALQIFEMNMSDDASEEGFYQTQRNIELLQKSMDTGTGIGGRSGGTRF